MTLTQKEEVLFFPELLSIGQLQKMTGYNKENYYDLVSMKGFPKFEDGHGRLKFPKQGVLKFIAAKTQYNFD